MSRQLMWLAACALAAQEVTFQAPALGYLYEASTATVRVVNGVPGAAILGPAVFSHVRAAAFCSEGEFGVISRPDGNVGILRSPDGSFSIVPISSSTRAAQVACGQRSAIVIVGAEMFVMRRDSGPLRVEPLTINFPADSIRALDYRESTHEFCFSGATDDSGAGLYLYLIDQNALTRVVELAQPGALARSQDTVYVVDDASMDVWSVNLRSVRSSAQRIITSSPGSRIVGMAAAMDEQRLFVADGGLNRLAVYGVEGNLTDILPIPVPVTSLRRTSRQTLLVSYEKGEPIYLLNDAVTPAAFFVPASQTRGSN